jgi:hypothetical protein
VAGERQAAGGDQVDITGILISQYGAALDMLRQTIVACPEPAWNAAGDKNKTWQVAYHALFFTHLYVEDSEDSFTPWIKHRDQSEDFDEQGAGEPYSKETILEYLGFCWQYVAERVPRLDLESSFDRRPYNKLELQIYSIRHIMQHTGELMERVGARGGAEIDWVGSKHV